MNTYTPDGRDLRAEIAPYLHPDETLLWVGQPYTSKKFRPNPLMVVFMLFWFGFAVFWTVTASAAGGFFGLFGIPFLLIGGFMLYTLLIGQKKQLERTVYAVTERRAIILSADRRGTDCTEFLFSRLPNISMEEVNGTTGTIRFLPDTPYYGTSFESPRMRRNRAADYELRSAFLAIDDVQTVYRLISEQMHADK
jgi:hypothetical protein